MTTPSDSRTSPSSLPGVSQEVRAYHISQSRESVESMQGAEELAKTLGSSGDFSYEAMQAVLDHLPTKIENNREVTMHAKSSAATSWVFGLYVRGNMTGMTRAAMLMPEVTKYGNLWIADKFPGQEWSSWTANINMVAKVHIDTHNHKQAPNHTVSFGRFAKGELWLEVDDARADGVRWKQKGGKRVPGILQTTNRCPTTFDPHRYHGTMPWKGLRYSITAYTTRNVTQIAGGLRQQLEKLGFPVPSPATAFLLHAGDSDTDVDVKSMEECEHQLEHVLGQVPASSYFAEGKLLERMISKLQIWLARWRPQPSTPTRVHGVLAQTSGNDGGEGSCGGGADAPTSPDGGSQMRNGLEALGQSDDLDAGHHRTGAGEQQSRPGGPEHQEEEQEDVQQERVHFPRDRSATPSKRSPQALPDASGKVSTPCRCSSLPSQCEQSLVDVHEMRESVATFEGGRVQHPAAHRDDARSPPHGRLSDQIGQRARARISESTSSSKSSASTRRTRSGDGPNWEGEGSSRGSCRTYEDHYAIIDYNHDGALQHDRTVHFVEPTSAHDYDHPWIESFEFGQKEPVAHASIVGGESSSATQDAACGFSGLPHEGRSGGVSADGIGVVRLGDDRDAGGSRAHGPAVILYGQELQDRKDEFWGGLRDSLQSGGWMWKSVLLLLTMVQFGSQTTWPQLLGQPSGTMSWNPVERSWRSESSTSDQGQCGYWCYVFDNHNRYGDWLVNDFGQAHPLTKEQRCFVAKRLGQRATVAEIYSPPRVIARAKRFGFRPGFALDLVTGWDFDRRDHREEAPPHQRPSAQPHRT